MKKFYAVFVLGAMACLAGCGEKNDQAMTMSPSEQLAAGKEIVISLNAQTPTTGTTAIDAAGTSQPLLQDMAAPTVVIENPTNQQIQQALKNAGLYDGAIDGSLGKRSKAAIKTFQEQNGLTADGKVGKKTWAKLGTYLGAASISETPAELSN